MPLALDPSQYCVGVGEHVSNRHLHDLSELEILAEVLLRVDPSVSAHDILAPDDDWFEALDRGLGRDAGPETEFARHGCHPRRLRGAHSARRLRSSNPLG